MTGRADRPGELGGIGPVDPDLARDLAAGRGPQPPVDLVRHRHRPGRARGRPRLRPTRETPQTRRARSARQSHTNVLSLAPSRIGTMV